MTKHVSYAIIGAGSSGLTALRQIRKITEDFVLVSEWWGTTCVLVGCMPSKALIEAANARHRATDFDTFGIRGADHLSVDGPAVMHRVRQKRDGLAEGPLGVRDEIGERAISGHATLLGPNRFEVNGQEFTADHIILATGSTPNLPQAWADLGDQVMTTDQIFEMPDLPERLAVIGLGAIGAELALAFARLGVEVIAVGADDRPAGSSDPSVAKSATEILNDEVTLRQCLNADLKPAPDGRLTLSAGDESWTVDRALVATGRKPNITKLGLDNLGIQLNEKGFPATYDPDTLRIGDLPIWIVGDANGSLPILHEASDEGYIAAVAAGENAVPQNRIQRRTPMGVTFSHPDIGFVGEKWSDLFDDDTDFNLCETVIGTVDFARQGRAGLAEINRGTLRVYASRNDGTLLGAEFCAPGGEHLAHILGLAMQSRLTVHQVLSMPFYHPTLEEGLRTALRDAANQTTGGGRSDLASFPLANHPCAD